MGALLEVLPVILNVLLYFSVTPASVEVVILHFLVCLIVVPSIVVEPVYRTDETGSMPATRAVNIKRPIPFVLYDFQKLVDRLAFRIILIAHWDIEVAHLGCLSG